MIDRMERARAKVQFCASKSLVLAGKEASSIVAICCLIGCLLG